MRVLVAGGAGFLGYHVCKALRERGAEVVTVDDHSSSMRTHYNDLAEIGCVNLFADIAWPVGNWGGGDLLDMPFTHIINLACPASPRDFAELGLHIAWSCSAGVRVLLDLAHENKATFLQASTSEVYGEPQTHPQVEEDRGNVALDGPRACYDEGKRFAEVLCNIYRERGVDVRIARIFNTYGPNMRADDGRLVPEFVRRSLRGEPLPVHGDGTQTRSLCYVSDLVDGLLRLLDSDTQGPVNLGNPHEVTVLDVAREIIHQVEGHDDDRTKDPAVVQYVDRPVNDPSRRCPDITKARELLGWEPQVGLEEGLAKTIEWFRKEIA